MPKTKPDEYHHFNLAIPKQLMPRLREVAKRNHRSVTQEIVSYIEASVRKEAEPSHEPVEPIR